MVNHNQKGASLFIALVMLVVLTVLAVSSMRGVVLESRMTGSMILESKLFNQAESTVSHIENKIEMLRSPMQACENSDSLCIKSTLLNKVVKADFKYDLKPYSSEFIDFSGTKIEGLDSSWYVIPAPVGDEESQSLNPEFGQALRGVGTFMYEVTVKSNTVKDRNENMYIRAVYSKEFGD